MEVFIIQDKYEDPMHYISSHPDKAQALKHKWDYEEFDMEDNVYEKDKYTISERKYCFSDYSEKCGLCRKGICMLENPKKDCEIVRRYADKEIKHSVEDWI